MVIADIIRLRDEYEIVGFLDLPPEFLSTCKESPLWID